MTDLRPETRAVHPPIIEPEGSRPLGMPLYQGHLFSFDSAQGMAEAFDGPNRPPFYSRLGNPTVKSFETALADLEGGVGALATASGMGAVNAVLHGLLRTGDHVIAQSCLYGGTYGSFQTLASKWGVEVTYVSGSDPDEIRAALRPNTRLLYLETIANPTTRVADLPALIAAAGPGVKKVVDNTFATPLLCRPLEHGADVVVHSATKYICGHGDAVAGVAVFASEEDHRTVWEEASSCAAWPRWACACPATATTRSTWPRSWRPTRRSRASPTRRCPTTPTTRSPSASSTAGAAASCPST
jgi:O-acetylhomoserine/O-acetylserine sulfhydrylase-like pyridoxal-dependent enzyme